MARRLGLLVLVVLLGLALWLWRGTNAAEPVAAPEAPPVASEVASAAEKTEAAPSAVRHEEAAPVSAPARTLLVVVCRAKETGAPLAGQSVRVYAERKPGRIPAEEIVDSGADGRVEHEVPPGKPLHVDVHPKVFGANASASREVEALAAGESREIAIELATQTDSRFCARVLARETKLPVAAADVRADSRTLSTDADGRFDLPYSTWSLTRVSIHARGHAECAVSAQAGHETPETALVLELERASTLVGLLKDGGSGKYVLQALTEGFRLQEQDPSLLNGLGFDTGDRKWSAEFDATGRAEIQGLPPNAPLRVSLLDGRKPILELPEVFQHPQVVARGMKIHNAGMPMVAAPMRLDGQRAVSNRPAPRLDEHGAAIRDALAGSDAWPGAE